MNTTIPARRRADATAPAFSAPGTLADFFSLALVDPSSAARRLAAWFDDRSPYDGSSFYDDAGALDDVADGDLDAADWVAVLVRDRRYPLDVRLGLAAVVAGVRARRDDRVSSPATLPVRR